jgi:site-specific recombinase XerD
MQAQNQPRRILQIVTPNQLYTWLRDFILDVRAANRSEATIGFYEGKLKPFLAYLEEQGVTEPGEITARHLRSFLVQLGESRESGGVHAYWRAVRAFVRFLVREDAIDRNPLEKMRSPILDQDLLDPVSTETVSALLATCDKSDICLLVAVAFSALVSACSFAPANTLQSEEVEATIVAHVEATLVANTVTVE